MFTIEITQDLPALLFDNELWDRLACGIPFRETSWLSPWWQAFGSDKQSHVLIARDESGDIVGILPLYRMIGGRTLSMIGDGQACSDHASVLARPERAEEVARQMARFLCSTATDSELGWDLIDIDGVIEGDTVMTAFAQELQTCGAALHSQSRMSVWFKPVDECWDEHLKHHGKTQRRQMRRMREKLETIEKVVATNEEQVDEILGAVIELHQRRWTLEGEPGSYADPLFRDFIFHAAKQFCSRGKLYLSALKVDEKYISGELRFIGDNRILYSYSSGYDIEYAEMEPGRLMSIDGLLELYRSDLAGIDFMRGDETYKTRYATESRRQYRLRAVPPTWIPKLKHVAWCTGFELKQWLRKRSGRPLIKVGSHRSGDSG